MPTIKQATLSDILVINELAHRIWPVTYKDILSKDQMEYMLDMIYSPSSLKKQMGDLQHTFIIAFEKRRPVGFASYSRKANSRNTYKIHKLYVLQSQQGRGIGRLMVDSIVATVKPSGAKFLELNVNRKNPALHFYEKNGFAIEGQEDIDIDNGYFMNDYIMRKAI